MHAIASNAPDTASDAVRFTPRRLPSLRFSLYLPGSAGRDGVESYIRARFAQRHGAQVTHFLRGLIALGDGERHCGAVGLASAGDGPLFAETYLDRPVEQLVADATGQHVERREILEIGNLVSTWKGSGLLLFVFLTELVARLGYRWVLFTATHEVEALLGRIGHAPVVLAEADPARLPDRGASWGSYYARGPRVMFGEVPPALAFARRRLAYRLAARAMSRQVDRVCGELRG